MYVLYVRGPLHHTSLKRTQMSRCLILILLKWITLIQKQSYFMTSVTFNHIFQHQGPEPDRGEDELHQGLAESPGIWD